MSKTLSNVPTNIEVRPFVFPCPLRRCKTKYTVACSVTLHDKDNKIQRQHSCLKIILTHEINSVYFKKHNKKARCNVKVFLKYIKVKCYKLNCMVHKSFKVETSHKKYNKDMTNKLQ